MPGTGICRIFAPVLAVLLAGCDPFSDARPMMDEYVERVARVLETDPERRIDVSWNSQKGTTRAVKIRVISLDQKGILATITKVITKCEANILRASVYTKDDGRGIHSFEVDVRDVQHLTRVIDAIQKIKGVHLVERVRGGGRR